MGQLYNGLRYICAFLKEILGLLGSPSILFRVVDFLKRLTSTCPGLSSLLPLSKRRSIMEFDDPHSRRLNTIFPSMMPEPFKRSSSNHQGPILPLHSDVNAYPTLAPEHAHSRLSDGYSQSLPKTYVDLSENILADGTVPSLRLSSTDADAERLKSCAALPMTPGNPSDETDPEIKDSDVPDICQDTEDTDLVAVDSKEFERYERKATT